MTPPAAARALADHRLAAPARPLAPVRPRRVSGPSPAPQRSAGAAAPARALPAALAGAARARLETLLDRLLSGRAWIGVVAFALIGIVTLQLGLLQLNRSIGRTLERETALQRENSALSIENSEMAAGDRVEASAEKLGMTLVAPGALRFLRARPSSDPARAAAALNAAPAGTGEASYSSTAEAGGQGTTSEAAGEAGGEPGGAPEAGGEVEARSAPSQEAAAPETGAGDAGGASSTGATSGTGASSGAAAGSESAAGGAGAAAAPSGGAQASPAG